MSPRTRVDRWFGGPAAAVLLAAAGVLMGSPTVMVAAAIPVAYVVYGALDRVDLSPSAVTVERELDRETAFPGDRIDVTLRVTNRGDRPFADLRVADLVPESVAVVDGRPRAAASLRPGEAAVVEYAVSARRGDHEFGPVRVRARSTSGTEVVTVDLTPEGSTTLSCRPDLDSVPLAPETRRFAGAIGADDGGSGVEFHSTREYRRGDPVSRIDWRRLAKTGDLTTVDYREHRSARVVLAVDARDACHLSPEPGVPTGAGMCAFGARRAFEVLRAAGHQVGAVAFGVPNRTASGVDLPAWIPPGDDDETQLRIRRLLDEAAEPLANRQGSHDGDRDRDQQQEQDRNQRRSKRRPSPGRPGDRTERPNDGGRPAPDGGPTRPDDRVEAGRGTGAGPIPGEPTWNGNRNRGSTDVEALCGHLPPKTQLLLFTPALDRFPVEATRTVLAYGHRVTVVSPDVTTGTSTGGRLRAVERDLALDELRAAGGTVVDWDRDRPLALAISSVLEEL